MAATQHTDPSSVRRHLHTSHHHAHPTSQGVLLLQPLARLFTLSMLLRKQLPYCRPPNCCILLGKAVRTDVLELLRPPVLLTKVSGLEDTGVASFQDVLGTVATIIVEALDYAHDSSHYGDRPLKGRWEITSQTHDRI